MNLRATDPPRDILFVGNGRCYHTLDWYRNARRLRRPGRVLFATDLIESEGHVRVLGPDDDVVNLLNIDRLLLKEQSLPGNIWRNLVKFVVLPFQVYRLRRLARRYRVQMCHAHSMYYMYLCCLARVPFVGTPQGSEVLVRPWRSALYRHFAVTALRGATHITVDSSAMQDAIMRLCGRSATIVQNGVDLDAIKEHVRPGVERTRVLSIRNIFPLYRIAEIVAARDRSQARPALTLTYASWEDTYRGEVRRQLQPGDLELGRLMPKTRLFEVLSETLLAISIPSSDSSPRSVYEAIFCGCCVAVTPSSWFDPLPDCMRSRLTVVDLSNPHWLDTALMHAARIVSQPYVPSQAALEQFDQNVAAKVMVNTFYGDPRSLETPG